MIRAILSLGFSLFIFVPAGHAADVAAIRSLFEQNYRGSFYQRARCGQNTENLIRLAMRQGVDLSGASLVQMINVGNSNFGLVAAYKAREQGRLTGNTESSGLPVRHTGSANWEYHAFVIAEGLVFDFDFENHPTILPVREYAEEMFLAKGRASSPDVRRGVFSAYEVEVSEIHAVSPSESSSARLADFLTPPKKQRLWDFVGR